MELADGIVEALWRLGVMMFMVATIWGDRITSKRLNRLEDESRQARRHSDDGGGRLD